MQLVHRYRAVVAYDGTDYFGFQRQVATQPTIQSELERAVSQIASRPVTIQGAGRTDSGVHAVGQVVSFELAWTHGDETLQRAINANLPDDIAIAALETCRPGFHPRYDARQRVYRYYIYNQPTRSPLQHRYSWHVRRPLALAAMNEAAAHLVGVHDFATFGQPTQGESTTRELFAAAWQRRAEMLEFTIAANAFLYRMVRSIVGALKAVGEGAWTPDAFVDAFRAADRSRAATTAPPQGLHLVSVTYED